MISVKKPIERYNNWFYNTLPKHLKTVAPHIAIGAVVGAAAFYGAKKGTDGMVVEVHLMTENGIPITLQST